MKPYVEGFLRGCRPYLAIDSTLLTGKFRGQLCIACAVDGHNWMYPVAIRVLILKPMKTRFGSWRGLRKL